MMKKIKSDMFDLTKNLVSFEYYKWLIKLLFFFCFFFIWAKYLKNKKKLFTFVKSNYIIWWYINVTHLKLKKKKRKVKLPKN